jgi:DNA-binding response OmpR family regulator
MEERKKILLVDDEKDFCFFVKGNLERTGAYDVIATTTAKEGLKLARTESPDLVLLDISMPEMSGDELAVAMGDDAETDKIPIIFLTAILTKRETAGEIYKEIGGRKFLAKPVTTRELVAAIDAVLT